jgi:hypothetical protein
MRGLVAAGAECLVAGARQHDARDVAVIGGKLKSLNELLKRLAAKRIVDLRPVDNDPGGAVADFVDHVGELARV